MPFAQPTASPDFPVLYDLEQAVGSNAPNAHEDVRLVQYMLKCFYGSQAGNLSIDGYFGGITGSWITRFQLDCKKAGNEVLADGRMDRAFGITASVSKTIYTIVLLNYCLRKTNRDAFDAIPQQVKLNPNPKANPYNPAKATGPKTFQTEPVLIQVKIGDGVVYLIFDDGSIVEQHFRGTFEMDGSKVMFKTKSQLGL